MRPARRSAAGCSQICPWCYIGQQELKRAIEAVADLPITINVEFRPFCLQPALPVDTALDKREWYVTKFGDKLPEIERRIKARAEELGLDM